jgi:SAM-dependent methyltransferase
MTVPSSWFGPSSHNLALEFVDLGFPQMKAISFACARKYGTSEYFAMHREEREKVNWSAIYLEICQRLGIDIAHKQVLVVGVNDGMDIEPFNCCQVIGIDPCNQALALAKIKFPHHKFQIALAESLPLEEASVDAYIALRVINCSTVDLKSLVGELNRTLKPNGSFIISIANGFFDKEIYNEGVFRDGKVDLEYANHLKNDLLNLLRDIGTQLTIVEHPIETFVFGVKTSVDNG